MVGVQAGHETAHTPFRRPQQAGRFATGGHRPVDVDYVRDQVPGLVGGQVDAESEELFQAIQPPRDPWQPTREALPVEVDPRRQQRLLPVSTSIACLSNRTSSESLSQKQPQAAQPAHTCGKPAGFGIPRPACRAAVGPTAIPGMAAAVEDARTEVRYGVPPTAAQPRGETRHVI